MLKASPGATSISAGLLDGTYRKTVLPNGLRVVTEEIPHVRSASIGVWVDIGSRDENERNNGITHFIEHMVFKGTEQFSLKEIARSLESVGGYLNAFTSKEHTCFYARCLDADIPTAVRVISDLVCRPVFPPRELTKEKEVVLEELKNIQDDPDDLIGDYFDQSIYNRHPLRLPVIGTARNIKSFSRNQLFEYLHRHYVPSSFVVAGAGHVKHEDIVDLVRSSFPEKSRRTSRRLRAAGPSHQEKDKRVYERPITQAHLCLGTVGFGVRSRHRYPMLVLNTLLGEGMSSRLFQSLRERHALAYSVYSFTNTMSDTGNFGVYAATDAKHVDRAIALIHRELGRLRNTPVGPGELARTKSQLVGTMMLSLESMSSRMMRLGTSELYYGHQIPVDQVVQRINSVTAEEIEGVARDLFSPDRFSTVVLRPNSAATRMN